METQTNLPNPSIDLLDEAWRHLLHTLFHLLPPPLTNTPEGRRTRNRAAIARIAALDPVNANEAELAAQCVVARAQAEDIMRLVRVNAGDIALMVKLNAQYTAMVRISLAAQNRLIREQQRRRKREENPRDADADAWTRHIVANTMLQAMPPESEQESHAVENETSMRQQTNQLTTLPTTPSRAPDQGSPDDPAAGNGNDPDAGRLIGRHGHSDRQAYAGMAAAPPQPPPPASM